VSGLEVFDERVSQCLSSVLGQVWLLFSASRDGRPLKGKRAKNALPVRHEVSAA